MGEETKSISSQRGYQLVVKNAVNTPEGNSEEESDNLIISEINTGENNETEADQLETEENAKKSFSDVPQIQISKRRSTVFNRRLIPLRIAFILMASGARLPPIFFSVFLRDRGMSLIEFSAVVSATSFSQIFFASISGIIADKTGNAKAVLLFLLTTAVIFCVCLLLTPSMKNDTCERQKTDFTSYNYLKNVTKISDLDNCTYFCSDYKDFQHSGVLNDTLITELGINMKTYPSLSRLFNKSKSSEKFTTDFHPLNTFPDENFTENCSLTCSFSQRDCQTKGIVLLIIYAFLIFVYITFFSTAYRFMDVTILLIVKESNSSYAQERAFAMISETAVGLLVTFGMELVDSDAFYQNKYDLVYWISSTFMILAIIALCSFKAKINAPGKRLMTKALVLAKNVEFIVFVMVIFISGIVGNFFMYFNLWLLEDIKAEKILFGLNITIFSFCAIPGLLTSKWWLKKLGTSAIILLYLFFNFFIGFGYFFLHNPWLFLVLEGTRGFWCNLFLVAFLQHSHDIAPLELVATVTSVSLTTHFAFGRTAATLCGGLLMNAVGSRTTYKLLGMVSLTTAFLYGGFLFINQRKRKHQINVLEM